MVRDDIRYYYERKVRCPKCGSKNLAETSITILDLPEGKYVDKKNTTICNDCQWRGFVDDLRS